MTLIQCDFSLYKLGSKNSNNDLPIILIHLFQDIRAR